MTAPELHRPFAVSRIGRDGIEVPVQATPPECAALAHRLRLPALLSLDCRFRLAGEPDGAVAAEGRLIARVVQTCVVSLEEFEATVTDRFAVRFVPAGRESEDDDDDPESVDEIPYQGDHIDLGEAAAEQLALALDPYPRKPGAALPDEAGTAEPHPFAALAARRRPD